MLGIQTYQANSKSIEHSNSVALTHQKLYHIQQLLTFIIDIETGQRGYSLSQDKRFLEPLKNAYLQIEDHLANLENLSKDDKQQSILLDSLKLHLQQKIKFSNKLQLLTEYGELHKIRDIMLSMQGKFYMDKVRYFAAEMQRNEKTKLSRETLNYNRSFYRFEVIFVLLIVCMSLLVFIGIYIIDTSFNTIKKASIEIEVLYNNASYACLYVNESLEIVKVNNTLLKWLEVTSKDVVGKKMLDVLNSGNTPVQFTIVDLFKKQGWFNGEEFYLVGKYGKIPVVTNGVAIPNSNNIWTQAVITCFNNFENRNAKEKIERLNIELKETISRLEVVNGELESFSYSVSHDLRAPLRSIAGYTAILEEEYQKLLDDEGKRILTVIKRNARQMGQLIDDLLAFSHIGRKEVVKSAIDMNTLVHSIIKEIESNYNSSKVEICVLSLIPSRGDFNLLKQVWMNLITNAIKYSSKLDHPKVEIGSLEEAESIIYFVRDNGVGFNMNFAYKLFNVFQRLHKMNDFEGTGVGLAIVKRIIQKHGGRVWAEGSVGAGATFYFSLPV